MATTTAPVTDHLQHSKNEIQIPPNNIIDSIINNINSDKSLLLVPEEEEENDVVTIAHLTSANPPVAPFTPSPNSLSGKRKRLKPAKYKTPSIKKPRKKRITPNQKVKRDISTGLSLGNKKNGSKDGIDPAQISPTMVRAGEIQASLGNEYPSFCKMMVRSHVTSCFWMGLPLPFCKSFLPQQESPIVVEDENGEEQILKYIAYRFGLSAGWRTFAVGHNLHEGDVLIFQLVEPCKFKFQMATTTAPVTDHLQHSKNEIQIPPNNIIDSIINNINSDKSLLLVPEEEEENDVVTIAHLTSANPPVAPFTPSPNSLSGKRKRLKPAKYKTPSIKKPRKKRITPNQKVKRDISTGLSLGNKKNGSKDGIDPAQISPTMVRAGEIQASLGNEYPSFCKMMVRSHVTSCFWMGLPLPFCKSFLPQQESPIVVEDENGEEQILKYIAYRFGLSAGWRTFAVGHNLHEGDVLIFQLVEPCKFKIYIVRTDTPNVVDSAIRLLKDTEHKEQITPEIGKAESKLKGSKSTDTKSNGRKSKTDTKPKGRKPSTSLLLTMVQKKQKQSEPPPQLSSQPMEHSAVVSEVQEGSAQPNLAIELKTFKDFHLMVNKWCIDSELSEEIRLDYYNLCVAKNEILHDGVLDGVYYKLVAGMIGETVRIANVIKNCKPTTKKERFDVWDSSLKSFEIMGMKVGFLRNRIRALATLAFESKEAKRCMEAKAEKTRNTHEIRILEAKVAELYENNRKIDVFLGGLKEKLEGCEVEFQKKINEPW